MYHLLDYYFLFKKNNNKILILKIILKKNQQQFKGASLPPVGGLPKDPLAAFP